MHRSFAARTQQYPTVNVRSTFTQATYAFQKLPNTGISMYEKPKILPDGTEVDPPAIHCLLMAFEQAARIHHRMNVYSDFRRAAKNPFDPEIYDQCPFALIRRSIAELITSLPPDESLYKLFASLLADEMGDDEAMFLYSRLPSEKQYLDRAKQFLSDAQIQELERLPTTISDRIEVATNLSKRLTNPNKFAAKARQLEKAMSYLSPEQRARLDWFEPPSFDRQLKQAERWLTDSQRQSVYQLDPIPDRIKALVAADIQSKMLTWPVFYSWVSIVYPEVNVVPCLYNSKHKVYDCAKHGGFNPSKVSIFIARNGDHYEALIPVDSGLQTDPVYVMDDGSLIPVRSTHQLENDLYVMDGWREASAREICVDGTSVTIYASVLRDKKTVAIHILPQNILRLVPVDCDFINDLTRIPSAGPKQLHRFDPEICDNLYVSPVMDESIASVVSETSIVHLLGFNE